jgi:hypothetical protein
LCKRDRAWLRGSWETALHSTVSLAGHTQRRSKSGPILSIYFCAHDTSEAGKKPFGIGVNRIDRGFHHDPATARCDVKSEGGPLLSVMSGTSLIGSWEISRLSHFQEGPSDMEHVSIEVRTGRETPIPYNM